MMGRWIFEKGLDSKFSRTRKRGFACTVSAYECPIIPTEPARYMLIKPGVAKALKPKVLLFRFLQSMSTDKKALPEDAAPGEGCSLQCGRQFTPSHFTLDAPPKCWHRDAADWTRQACSLKRNGNN